jgi:lipopolysaccharide biosynthesis glycosyltransferase
MSNAIVMLVDDNSFLGACVTIYSIKEYAKLNYDLIVYTWNKLSQDNRKNLLKINDKIIFKNIPQSDYNNCKFGKLPRVWDYNCAFRFEIFTLSEYKKILYIDCDFLVQNDITQLFKHKCSFGAVKAAEDYMAQGNKHFNAGLLLIDNVYLDRKVKEELIAINLKPAPTFNNSREWISDEPVLNTYFKEVKYLKKKFNYLVTSLEIDEIDNNNYHFNGTVKPWQTDTFYKAYNECFLQRFLNKNGPKGLIYIKKIFDRYQETLSICRKVIL